jgi:NADPH2:quinone reductase
MRAVVVRRHAPFREVEVEDLPAPEPGRGEVVVDLVAAEVNFPDLLVIEGKYQARLPLPFSPGTGGAGRIATIGAGVEGLEVGQPVVVHAEHGAFAEKLRTSPGYCFPMPDGMSFEQGAALGLVYQTAWFALTERAALGSGEVVLVLGAAGGIGMAAVQLAKALGAGMVIGGVRGEANAELARRLGADHVVELGDADMLETLRATVRELSGGHGADVVIDPVGGDAHTAALRAMAWSGRMVIVGFASGSIPTIRANYLLVKNISVSGLQWTDYRDNRPDRMREAQHAIFKLYRDGAIAPHISRTYPLDRFKEALAVVEAGKAQGKIILTMPNRG